MRPFTIRELSRLANAYCEGKGISLWTLSKLVFSPSNDRALPGLAEGKGISAKNAEAASGWFVANWPEDLPWPEDVPAPNTEAA